MARAEPNNNPLHAPLYPSPVVPYSCPGNRTLNAICEGREEAMKEILSYTPFEYLSNRFVISISDFSNCTAFRFMDVGVIFPVRFRDVIGGFWAYEYEDNDESIAAGREIWGYPKKYATARLDEEKDRIVAVVERKGVRLVKVELVVTGEDVPTVQTYPHLNLQVVPNADGPGVLLKRVIARDTSSDFIVRNVRTGQASVTLGRLDSDPIHRLGPTKVLGGVFTTGDFYANDKHGWGKVVSNI